MSSIDRDRWLASILLTSLDEEIAKQVNSGNIDPKVEIDLTYIVNALRDRAKVKNIAIDTVKRILELLINEAHLVILDPPFNTLDELLEYLLLGGSIAVRTRLGEFLYYLIRLRQRFPGDTIDSAKALIDDVKVLIRRRFYFEPVDDAPRQIREFIRSRINELQLKPEVIDALGRVQEVIEAFIKRLEEERGIKLTYFQLEALKKGIDAILQILSDDHSRALIISAPTGTGKTEVFVILLLVYALLMKILEEVYPQNVAKPHVVVIYPRRLLVIDQLMRINEYVRILNDVLRDKQLNLELVITADYGDIPFKDELVVDRGRGRYHSMLRVCQCLDDIYRILQDYAARVIDENTLNTELINKLNQCSEVLGRRHVETSTRYRRGESFREAIDQLIESIRNGKKFVSNFITISFGIRGLRKIVLRIEYDPNEGVQFYIGFPHVLCGCKDRTTEYAIADLGSVLRVLGAIDIAKETPISITKAIDLKCKCGNQTVDYSHILVCKPSRDSFGDIHIVHAAMLFRYLYSKERDPLSTVDMLLNALRVAKYRMIIMDEVHLYTGLFGSRISTLFRTLDGLQRDQRLMYVFSSATIPYALEFVQQFLNMRSDYIINVSYKDLMQTLQRDERTREKVRESGADYVILLYNSLREQLSTAVVAIQVLLLIYSTWLRGSERLIAFIDEYDSLARLWRNAFVERRYNEWRGAFTLRKWRGEELKCRDRAYTGLHSLRIPIDCTLEYLAKWFKVRRDCSTCVRRLGPDIKCPLYRVGECWWIASKLDVASRAVTSYLYSERVRDSYPRASNVTISSAQIILTTSAAEVGVDYRNVRAIYQHGLPPRMPLATIVQRMGRGGREAIQDPLARTLVVVGLNALNPYHTTYYSILAWYAGRVSFEIDRVIEEIVRERIALSICNPRVVAELAELVGRGLRR